jgi:hypothetical protein
MRKLAKTLVVTATAVAAALPVTPAFADDNPCKGQAPGPHCRPACFYYVYYDLGDPQNGVAPTVELRETFC